MRPLPAHPAKAALPARPAAAPPRQVRDPPAPLVQRRYSGGVPDAPKPSMPVGVVAVVAHPHKKMR